MLLLDVVLNRAQIQFYITYAVDTTSWRGA